MTFSEFRFGFGDGTFNISDSFGTADTKRHTAIIDGMNSVAKLVTNGTTNSYDYSGFAHGNTATWPMGVFRYAEQPGSNIVEQSI